MLKKTSYLKIIWLIVVVILAFLFMMGYRLSYKRDLEKIDKKILNF
jgi:predicted negative regulator of RcsB-dependent stress response